MIKGARITVIGFGNMGQALAQGFIENGLKTDRIHAVDPDKKARDVAHDLGIDFSRDLSGLAHPPSVVLLAIKPQLMKDVLPSLREMAGETPFFLSIAAGTNIATLQKYLSKDARIVRAMPNTPAAIGYGMTVLTHSGNLAFQQLALAETLMACVGACEWLENEDLMDAVTAVSGSGPAYFFYLIEALAKAGQKHGLEKKLAEKLAIETCRGAGQLAVYHKNTKSPEDLRKSVMSKGGTTEAAIEALQAQNFEKLIDEAVDAAVLRGQSLK